MPKKKPVDLKGRWNRTVAREVNALLVGKSLGHDFSSPHVGTVDVDGRTFLDLRGFPFTILFKAVGLDRIDFSGCGPSDQPTFTEVNLTDCRFVGARLDGSIDGTFTDCRFDQTTFTDVIGWPETRFVRCTFEEPSFRKGIFRGSVFEDCSFRDCRMPRTEFCNCRFAGCDFAGAKFQEGTLGGSVISRARNNFKYVDPNNVQIKYEFVADPSFPMVDLGETSVGPDTIFRAD